MSKKILIIIFLILIIFIPFLFWKKINFKIKKSSEDNVEKIGQLNSGQKNIENQNQEDVKKKFENKPEIKNKKTENIFFYQKAIQENNIVVCQKIDISRSKNLCLIQVAQKKQDLKICDTIDNMDLKEKCVYDVLLSLALKEKNLKTCVKMSSFPEKKSCIEKVSQNINDSEKCREIDEKELKAICLNRFFYSQAIKNKDSDLCYKVFDLNYRASCLSKLLNIPLDSDNDQDNLSFLKENIYGTDFNNKDTDGDGFLDGDEVEDGYNPKGEGLLDDDSFKEGLKCINILDQNLRNSCMIIADDNNFLNWDKCWSRGEGDLKDYCEKEFKRRY